eukprot:4108902-Prymnesium_polylepis.1
MGEALADVNVVRGPSRHYVKDYAVQELLGKGAFGSVYQVKKDAGETLYAMKELPIESVSAYGVAENEASDVTAKKLGREVAILSRLHHPNIIRYYESFRSGSALYIVMEVPALSCCARQTRGVCPARQTTHGLRRARQPRGLCPARPIPPRLVPVRARRWPAARGSLSRGPADGQA